jgi:hypothetical protein
MWAIIVQRKGRSENSLAGEVRIRIDLDIWVDVGV